MFFLNAAAFSQTEVDTNVSVYPGGVDSLEKHVWKNMRDRFEINADHFLFFRIVLSNEGIKSVQELYGDSSNISSLIAAALLATNDRWVKPHHGILNIVVPFFSIIDRDSKIGRMAPTLTYAAFRKNRNLQKCILFPPIVITYYPSSHKKDGM
jgi:hypothetical protein